WRLREVELHELCRDGVQPPYRAAVIVFPVALEELLREPPQLRRVTGQWFHRVGHRAPLLPEDSSACRPPFVLLHKRSTEHEKSAPEPACALRVLVRFATKRSTLGSRPSVRE